MNERSPKEKPRLVLIMGGRMEQQREEAKRRAEIREFRNDFPVCSVYIPLDHFQRRMPQNLLQRVHIAAVFQIARSKGMSQQVCPQPFDARGLL